MSKFLLFILFAVLPGTLVLSQTPGYWQQEVNYTIDVSLNDKEHTLDGFEKIEYINNSPDTLKFIWFHLWPNAFKNDRTAFTDQQLGNGNTRFYFSPADKKGYINRLDFKVNNITAQLEDHPQHIDIVKLLLPTPLAPKEKITISTPFHIKLPANFSRSGYDGDLYQVTQWYPKPAVYDRKGWHPMPYLDQGEFYGEFGSFDVSITVPKNYVVAATGELENEEEKIWLKERANFDWKPSPIKEKKAGGVTKTTLQLFPESDREMKTVRFRQSAVHDFAWFADKRFIVDHDTTTLASGKIVDIFAYYTPSHKEEWSKAVGYSKDAIQHYSRELGEYPYKTVSVVQGFESLAGGMEYPTITVIIPLKNAVLLDNIIAHEIGHNWFYGILASNEREHPWMDEGMNSFYDDKYYERKYGRQPQEERLLFEIRSATRKDQPIALHAEKYDLPNYFVTVYFKTAEWLRYMEQQIGPDLFKKAMQEYYNRWKFKHPQPEDFRKVLEEVSGKDLQESFALMHKKGNLPNMTKKGTRAGFIFNSKLLQSFVKKPAKNLLLAGPALGFNSYDKLLAGIFFTNMKLPPSALQFLAVPMYGTGSGRLNGIGFLNYKIYPDGLLRKIELGVSASSFTMDRFKAENGEKTYLAFQKIVPTVKFTFKEFNARSKRNRYIEFKSFLIGEDGLRFSRDSIFIPPDTFVVNNYGTARENRELFQLQLVTENNRALYPYRGELKFEHGKHFLRSSFTGKYFFNYSKESGLDLRLFAGKFNYLGTRTVSKEFATDRYHLNMTGPNGYEDYTYSDYFIGRNHFEGLASQQIMVRDGGFKVRTDLLADKVGRTDDWLMALNLTSSIPAGLNPLSILPIKIPLKVFADIGTHSEAWKQDAEGDRFLFDAGLQLSFFKETVNIYLPILYSRVFKDYIQSTIDKKGRLWKTISFSIDISNFNLRKLDSNLEF